MGRRISGLESVGVSAHVVGTRGSNVCVKDEGEKVRKGESGWWGGEEEEKERG